MSQTLGEYVRELRTSRGISTRALADAAGLSPTLISLIEAGKRGAGSMTLDRLACALRLSKAAQDKFLRRASERPGSHVARQASRTSWGKVISVLITPDLFRSLPGRFKSYAALERAVGRAVLAGAGLHKERGTTRR